MLTFNELNFNKVLINNTSESGALLQRTGILKFSKFKLNSMIYYNNRIEKPLCLDLTKMIDILFRSVI